MGLLLQNQVWDTIYNTFVNIFSQIGSTISNNAFMAIVTFAILLILIIYRSIKNKYTTEVLTYKAISKINDYLSRNPFITEENLVEFNRLMMKCPKTIRFQWQRFIINRDKKPSDFLNEENVITRPLRTNSYKQGLKSFSLSALLLCLFSAIFIVASHLTPDAQVGRIILSLVTPCIALFISGIYLAFGNILYNAIMSDLYYSYTNFEKNIDRAVTNMPEAIDYEIIFTSKEIQNGIPALQEFLEQRAIYEQEQIRKAKESEVEHETYNFDNLGVNGSLVMQRALKESELYLGNRRRLLAEIETIQTEKNSVEKDFDEENKTYQRNLRDIREEISSLKSKIEVVTNEITRSSLRRQQAAEVEKEQNIEKQIEKATNKFNDRIAKLNEEIDNKRKEIEESKLLAEKALTDEFKHFSDKTYKDLQKIAHDEVQEKVSILEQEKDELSLLLEEKDKLMVEKLTLYEDKAESYDSLSSENEEHKEEINELKNEISSLNQDIEGKNQEIFEVKQELESRKREILKKDEMIENFKKKKAVEIYRYFDANGTEFYFDDNDNPYYLDEEGNAVYYNQNAEENQVEEEFYDEQTEDAFVNEENQSEEPIEDLETENFEEETFEPVESEFFENFEEQFDEEEVAEELAEQTEETEVKKEKSSNKGRKNKRRKNKKETENLEKEEVLEKEIEAKKSEEEIVEEDAYKGIQDTLNKLALAAEEKMKEEDAKKRDLDTQKDKKKTSSKKKSSKKK